MWTQATGTTWKFKSSPLKVIYRDPKKERQRSSFQASFFRGFCCSNFGSVKSRLIGILTKISFDHGCPLLLGRGSTRYLSFQNQNPKLAPERSGEGFGFANSTSSDTTKKTRHLFAGKGVTFSEPGWRKDKPPWNLTNWYQELPCLKGLTFSKPSFWVSMLLFGGVVCILGLKRMQEAISQVASW